MKKKIVGKQGSWSIDDIKEGVGHFVELFKRYPTAHDFDTFDYLPSARTIQRSYGGLESLREVLGLGQVINFTKGISGSENAGKNYKRAVQYEEEFYNFLISKIPEVRVHEHKIIRPGHICCDFFIYTGKEGGVVIDLFYAKDKYSLGIIIRTKEKRYKDLKLQTFFISIGNPELKQILIEGMVENKKELLPKHIKVFEESYFKKNIETILGHQSL